MGYKNCDKNLIKLHVWSSVKIFNQKFKHLRKSYLFDKISQVRSGVPIEHNAMFWLLSIYLQTKCVHNGSSSFHLLTNINLCYTNTIKITLYDES